MDQPRGRKFSSQRCPFLWLRCLMKYHLEYCVVQFYQSLYILKSNAVYRFYLKRSFSPGNNQDKTQNEYYMPHCTWKSININQLCCNWETNDPAKITFCMCQLQVKCLSWYSMHFQKSENFSWSVWAEFWHTGRGPLKTDPKMFSVKFIYRSLNGGVTSKFGFLASKMYFYILRYFNYSNAFTFNSMRFVTKITLYTKVIQFDKNILPGGFIQAQSCPKWPK